MKKKNLEREVNRIFRENIENNSWEAWICKEALKLYLTALTSEDKVKALALLDDVVYHLF